MILKKKMEGSFVISCLLHLPLLMAATIKGKQKLDRAQEGDNNTILMSAMMTFDDDDDSETVARTSMWFLAKVCGTGRHFPSGNQMIIGTRMGSAIW